MTHTTRAPRRGRPVPRSGSPTLGRISSWWVNALSPLCQIFGISPTSAQTQAAAALAGDPLDPQCRSPRTFRCSCYFRRWTLALGEGASRGAQGRGSSARLGRATPLPLSPAMGPSQMGRCTLVLLQGTGSLAPPPQCCLQHPSPPNSHTVLSLSGRLPRNLESATSPPPRRRGLSMELIFVQD